MISIQRLLAPVDFSRESILAAKFAVSMAQEYEAELYLLHVIEPIPPYAMDYLPEDLREDREARLQKDLCRVIPETVKQQLQVQEILICGAPTHHVIVEQAKQLGVDIIVIATHGRTGLAQVMLGSVAEQVIRHASCPVFVIRNPRDKYVYGWE